MFRQLEKFEYLQPKTMEQAVQMLVEGGKNTRILAGGCDLIPAMRRRRESIDCIVHLATIPEISNIQDLDRELRIGAMASLHNVECFAPVKEDYTTLYEGIQSIASLQVRTTGTVVGNLCVGTPASDIAPPLMVLGASLKLLSMEQEKILPLDQFYLGPRMMQLAPGELVSEVIVPKPEPFTGSSFLKLVRTAADIAKICVASFISLEREEAKEVRIVMGAVAPKPVHAVQAEQSLKGQTITESAIINAADIAVQDCHAISDIRSDADYRTEMVRILVKRSLITSFNRARGKKS